MVVEATKDDPAISELPFEVFDLLSRTLCAGLDARERAATFTEEAAQQPTRKGIPMRLESAQVISAAGIRAYCPQHASLLADLGQAGHSRP